MGIAVPSISRCGKSVNFGKPSKLFVGRSPCTALFILGNKAQAEVYPREGELGDQVP